MIDDKFISEVEGILPLVFDDSLSYYEVLERTTYLLNECIQRVNNISEDPIVFVPSVSEDGVLSWSNNGGLPNPDPVDIDGDSGEGVPEGGETGQYLKKKSDEDYDTEWDDIDMPTKVSDLLNDAGYITGLNTVTYGASTYQDFLNAFHANKIVFCKAYAGDDPSIPTNAVRMAYLNYISAPVNPGKVEFAYYRSVKDRSATVQGDEVYIYTLTNNNEWSFVVRKTYTEIDTGTGLVKAYANGKLTLSATGGGGGGNGVTFVPYVSPEGVISWTNDGGLPNPEPVNIKGPTGATGSDGSDGTDGVTFTPSVSSAGVISWTNDGGLPNPSAVNIKGPAGSNGSDGADGDNGVTFTPSVSSAGIISWTNDGDLPNPTAVNIKGPAGNDGTNGDNGATFTPSVSSAGVISWTNDGGLPNPTPVNIKGATGATGPAGPGVPTGGTTGQILAKKSGTNYDTKWVNAQGDALPSGGEVGQVLTKTGAGDGVAGWKTKHLYLYFSFGTSPYTYTDSAITATMRVINVEFNNPSAIAGPISWTTNNGSITLSGNLNGATYVGIDLCDY